MVTNQNGPVFSAFLDVSKAYDSVERDLLWNKLETIGVSKFFLCALKGLHANVQSTVWWMGQYHDDLVVGLRKSDTGIIDMLRCGFDVCSEWAVSHNREFNHEKSNILIFKGGSIGNYEEEEWLCMLQGFHVVGKCKSTVLLLRRLQSKHFGSRESIKGHIPFDKWGGMLQPRSLNTETEVSAMGVLRDLVVLIKRSL
eukprot:g38880.t1